MTAPQDGTTSPDGNEQAPGHRTGSETPAPAVRRPAVRTLGRILGSLAVILFMANLNALVDSVLHPEIPYFDKEHLVVGGVTGFMAALLLILMFLYIHRLERAAHEIGKLRGLLPICAMCKKIRGKDNRWYAVERYVSEHSDASFTHGLCPECGEEVMQGLRKRQAQG